MEASLSEGGGPLAVEGVGITFADMNIPVNDL